MMYIFAGILTLIALALLFFVIVMGIDTISEIKEKHEMDNQKKKN